MAWAVEQEDGAELVVTWQSWLSGFSTIDAPLVVTILARKACGNEDAYAQ